MPNECSQLAENGGVQRNTRCALFPLLQQLQLLIYSKCSLLPEAELTAVVRCNKFWTATM